MIQTIDESLDSMPYNELLLLLELRSIHNVVREIRESVFVEFDPERVKRLQRVESELKALITTSYLREGS
jgi:hypothetical protein